MPCYLTVSECCLNITSWSEDNVQVDLNFTCIHVPTVSALKKLLQMELTLECIDDVEDKQVMLYLWFSEFH